jgi:hypothetical protein
MGASKGELHIAANGVMMLHRSRAASHEPITADGYRVKAQMLDTVDESMRSLYVARGKVGETEIRALMDAETWIGASRAVELGLADKITSVAPGARAVALAQAGDIPASVAEILAAGAAPCDDDRMNPEQKAVRQRLGLAETATDAEVLTAIEAAQNAPAPAPEPAPAVAATVDAQAVASLVLESLSKRDASAAHKDACDAAVERFIKARKISPASRDAAIAACGETAESLAATVAYWEKAPAILAEVIDPGSVPEADNVSPLQKRMAKAAGVKLETIKEIRKEEIEASQETR